ncbi:MAG: heparan-alpha-glucosaminide N-acetyltransferase domain-containing protein [Acidobacteria bacterium]|nr:heparan-alpha-glucosaminide N-acetyltransferase domain-containing protein [Acidobacteriota bacterium]
MAKQRHPSIDLLRGLVIVLMIIDHAQEYQAGPGRGLVTDPMNLAITPGPVYFWRILAHFCAPVFTLLMGISASLSGATPRRLAQRGVILILLELTVMNWAWTFNPFWHRYFFQIIAALGVAMLALAVASRFSRAAIGLTGLAIVCGHNLFDAVHFSTGTWQHYVWSFLHEKNVLPLWGAFEVRTTYPVLPVVGLALCGYACAPWLERPDHRLRNVGLAIIGLFFLLRLTNFYGDPHPTDYSLLSILNVTKYPLSLQFIAMTIGPALVFLSWAGTRRQPQLEQLGRTAMFVYVAHLVLLHALALGAGLLLGLPIDLQTRFGGIPDGIGFPVWATAPLALVVTALLYPLCRWYEPRRLRFL